MSIIRVGLSEDKGFSEGYEAIFGKKKKAEKKSEHTNKTENANEKKKKKTKK